MVALRSTLIFCSLPFASITYTSETHNCIPHVWALFRRHILNLGPPTALEDDRRQHPRDSGVEAFLS